MLLIVSPQPQKQNRIPVYGDVFVHFQKPQLRLSLRLVSWLNLALTHRTVVLLCS